jgi:hypothetical protein
VSYLSRRRRGDPLIVVGIAVSLLLHGGMAAAILVDRNKQVAPITVPREFVVARMVRLGQKRPKSWLPVIPARTSQAPRKAVGLTDNEHAAPARKRSPEERPADAVEAKALRRADTLAKVFAEAQKETDQEGDPSGSPGGTATEATPGDEYATACLEEVRKYWTVPPEALLSESVLAGLTAEVRLIIDQKGKVHQVTVKRASRNRHFDAGLNDALGRLTKLPAPPKDLTKGHALVGILLLFEGKDLRR